MKKFIIFIVGIIIVVIVVLSIFGKRKDVSEQGLEEIPTAVAAFGNISIILEEIGEIKPIKEVKIKSKISGRIQKMYVEEGEYIAKDDVIAEIEPDMQQAQTLSRIKSNFQNAEIELETAKRNYNSDKELFEKNFISSDDWQNTQDALNLAEINYESALEQYNLIQEIGITGEKLKISAPVCGTIISKNVEEGEMVVSSESYSGGTVLLTIADLSQMIILTEINEIDIGKISLDKPVDISIDAFPDKKYKGKITHIAPMAKIGNNNIRVFDIKISIENLDANLKPGMSANVTIIGKTRKNIITVPIQAIFKDDDGNNLVYKVVSDTLLTPEIVKVGINDFENVEIIEPIEVGDTISLKEGKKPVSKNEKENSKIGRGRGMRRY
ncbi:MAG: efflux RND transporter periplasmic adaptor subunit [Candidatus Cloacimonetes bacterium]|nr:efflux RND transporter periplasmic adaptor subunit [Candidatus Cloacimonadota bacterium]